MILNVFENSTTQKLIERINNLSNESKAKWGKMNVAQMLAHCNVTYEMLYENKHKAPSFFIKLILKFFVKKHVVNDVYYKPNTATAPAFIIANEREFTIEKERLINYIIKTQQLGANYFEGKESLSFGALTANEWNNLFYKHLDHHFKQFGV
ncbi:MAG: DUF1569 domain-containing protein [Bacteroidetes bacterium]|nr:DUF1569 domain-containing protein [Bacteroidota bacterium]